MSPSRNFRALACHDERTRAPSLESNSLPGECDQSLPRNGLDAACAIKRSRQADSNVAFPLDRLKELEAEGTIRRLAHTAVSMVGSIQRFTELVDQTVPAIKQVYDSQGVDLVLLSPFCPACHRATGVIARALEARGLPILSMNVLWEAGQEVKPPRTCFLDFPLGCPAGRPNETAQQRDILRAALKLAPEFDPVHWGMKTLPFEWSRGGSHVWKQKVDKL